jgi:hypothetical protein
VGHYKAILDDPSLICLHTTMMTLLFKHGFVPDWWTKITDIMLQKVRVAPDATVYIL